MWVIVSLLIQVGHVHRFVATGDIKSQLSNLFQLFSLSIYYLPVLTIEEVSSARILTSRGCDVIRPICRTRLPHWMSTSPVLTHITDGSLSLNPAQASIPSTRTS